MYTVQISDRDTFARQAKKSGVTVFVVRTATAIPVQRSGAVVMHPAVTLDYAMEFDHPSMGHAKWTFREVVLTDDKGELALSDSLWRILKEQSIPVRVIHRSGAF